MKRNHFALWSLLAAAFAIFLGVSMCDDPHIGSWHIKSSGMAEALLSHPADTVIQQFEADTLAADTISQQAEPDTVPKTVLFIGDSMVECLGPRMSAYCKAYGHQLYNVIWYSSTTELYGSSRLISDYIEVLHPDYIFISLGGNELFIKDIIEKRDKHVKSILAEVGDIPYLWIGPPNWKEDTGINQMIAQNVKPGCMFVTKGIEMGRKKDGAHPDAASSIMWMDSIVAWMPQNARYKLPFVEPENKTDRPVKQYMHKPGEITNRPK